jgi:hypothetical protein
MLLRGVTRVHYTESRLLQKRSASWPPAPYTYGHHDAISSRSMNPGHQDGNPTIIPAISVQTRGLWQWQDSYNTLWLTWMRDSAKSCCQMHDRPITQRHVDPAVHWLWSNQENGLLYVQRHSENRYQAAVLVGVAMEPYSQSTLYRVQCMVWPIWTTVWHVAEDCAIHIVADLLILFIVVYSTRNNK